MNSVERYCQPCCELLLGSWTGLIKPCWSIDECFDGLCVFTKTIRTHCPGRGFYGLNKIILYIFRTVSITVRFHFAISQPREKRRILKNPLFLKLVWWYFVLSQQRFIYFTYDYIQKDLLRFKFGIKWNVF